MNTLTVLGLFSMAFVTWFTCRAYVGPVGQGQSRRESIIEAWVNLVIGFGINFSANFFLLPLTSHQPLPVWDNFMLGWCFTTVSIVRQYAIRRFFNSHALAHKLAVILGAR